MAKKQHFLCRLLGTRPDWPDAMTEEEQRVMGEHFVYLRRLTWAGKVLLAGPVMEGWGLVALETEDEEEARAILAADPSVLAGVHTFEMGPFVASLLHGRDREPGE